jgi:alpha-N-acetylglucosamine transferase
MQDEMELKKEKKVTVKNMADFSKEVWDRDGDKLFAMKGAILLNTEFDEVLFLDSDNLAAVDPTFLFDTPAFKETGAIFWPDFWKTKGDNHIWKILDISCPNEYEQESGQILIRKSHPGVMKALQLAFYIQKEQGIYKELILGDKDTFRLAWRTYKVPYHMVVLG